MTDDLRARFTPGDSVRVSTRSRSGHCRTPAYIKGKTGYVEAVWGHYHNPEDLAYGRDGLPQLPLYHVAFYQRDIWGEAYTGRPDDTLSLDIYDHWLETI